MFLQLHYTGKVSKSTDEKKRTVDFLFHKIHFRSLKTLYTYTGPLHCDKLSKNCLRFFSTIKDFKSRQGTSIRTSAMYYDFSKKHPSDLLNLFKENL